MKILISPAKTLDFKSQIPIKIFSENAFLKQAEKLNRILRIKNPKQLSKLMSISDKLGELNWQRNQDWQLPFNQENARQAIYAFNGTVYEGINSYTIPFDKIQQLQDKLRILSGQYGILKPLDLIQPYRLEMGTRLIIGAKENLYQFWGDSLTNTLNEEMDDNETLVNLASNEYYKVIKPKLLKSQVVTPVFKDFKNGKLRMISFFAKKARGMMVRFIIDNNIENPEELKGFNRDGYAYDANLSTETELVFTR